MGDLFLFGRKNRVNYKEKGTSQRPHGLGRSSRSANCANSIEALDGEFGGVGVVVGMGGDPDFELGVHGSGEGLDAVLELDLFLGLGAPVGTLGVLVLAVVAEVVTLGDLKLVLVAVECELAVVFALLGKDVDSLLGGIADNLLNAGVGGFDLSA